MSCPPDREMLRVTGRNSGWADACNQLVLVQVPTPHPWGLPTRLKWNYQIWFRWSLSSWVEAWPFRADTWVVRKYHPFKNLKSWEKEGTCWTEDQMLSGHLKQKTVATSSGSQYKIIMDFSLVPSNGRSFKGGVWGHPGWIIEQSNTNIKCSSFQ